MSHRATLDSLCDEARTIAEKADALVKPRSGTPLKGLGSNDTPSRHLAHYTSLEAIVSMLQDSAGGLRLSDSATMNDPDEGRATADGRLLHRLLKDPATPDWVRRRYESAYICCFVGVDIGSAERIDAGDDLLFWRLYGHECRGISIRMPPHLSDELVASSVIRRVDYTDEPPVQIDLGSMSAVLQGLDGLRTRALSADLWGSVCEDVLPSCDRLFGERFLHKRRHYEMEREYRAVVFDTPDDTETRKSAEVASRGTHVQFGLCRRFVQLRQLNCEAILTTNSQITIGSNVPDAGEARQVVSGLVKARELPHDVIRIRVSKMRYRPR